MTNREQVCRCEHRRRMHVTGKKGERCNGSKLSEGWGGFGVPFCQCTTFDDSWPPADGERLEFGRHRQRSPDAETAPAWKPEP